MPAQWTGELVGKMHNNRVSSQELAAKIGCSTKWLSMVLNGHCSPKGAEQRQHQKQRQHVVELILSLFGVLRHHRPSLRHAAGFSPALCRHPHGAPFLSLIHI